MSPPPSYPPIHGNRSETPNNLFSSYVDMLPSDLSRELEEVNWEKFNGARYGVILPLEIFQHLFLS
jgi:hypothetical protein